MGSNIESLKKRSRETSSGCWEWTGGRHGTGYGCVPKKDGGGRYAHRAMYEAAFGAIPKGLYVLHHCDNRLCINPAHLFLGSHLDNIKDMHAKGRQSGGSMPNEANPFCKFSNDMIRGIRAACKAGVQKREIEKTFSISETHYYRVVKGVSRGL